MVFCNPNIPCSLKPYTIACAHQLGSRNLDFGCITMMHVCDSHSVTIIVTPVHLGDAQLNVSLATCPNLFIHT